MREREGERERGREQSSPLQDQKEGRLSTHITLKFLMSWSLFTLQHRNRIPLNSLPHGPTGNNPFDCLFPFSSWWHPPQTLASAPGWTSGLWICCPVISWSQSLASPWVFILPCVISYSLDLNALPCLDLLLCFHRAYSAVLENVTRREVRILRLHFSQCHFTVILNVQFPASPENVLAHSHASLQTSWTRNSG